MSSSDSQIQLWQCCLHTVINWKIFNCWRFSKFPTMIELWGEMLFPQIIGSRNPMWNEAWCFILYIPIAKLVHTDWGSTSHVLCMINNRHPKHNAANITEFWLSRNSLLINIDHLSVVLRVFIKQSRIWRKRTHQDTSVSLTEKVSVVYYSFCGSCSISTSSI